MANLQAILAYQEIDKKMFALEKEISDSAERKAFVRLKKYLEGASEKLDALEAKATGLKTEAVQLTKNYLAAEETLQEFEHLDELVAGGADLDFYKKKANLVLDKMKKIKADLASIEKRVKETDEEYQALKAEVKSKQKEYKEAQEKFAAYKATKELERQAIEKELSVAAKTADEGLLARYKTKRKEKIFPVLAQFVSGRCSYCGMEPPIVANNELKGGKHIDCENCHKILYCE